MNKTKLFDFSQNLIPSKEMHNINKIPKTKLFMVVVFFPFLITGSAVESSYSCYKVSSDGQTCIFTRVFSVIETISELTQEDKSWSGNVIVNFFHSIQSHEECQELCQVSQLAIFGI